MNSRCLQLPQCISVLCNGSAAAAARPQVSAANLRPCVQHLPCDNRTSPAGAHERPICDPDFLLLFYCALLRPSDHMGSCMLTYAIFTSCACRQTSDRGDYCHRVGLLRGHDPDGGLDIEHKPRWSLNVRLAM